MKTQRIIYWIATLLVCGIFLYSAQMYFRNTEAVQGYFEHLNYPGYIVIPLAIAKIIAIIMVCLLYTSPSPRDRTRSRMPSSA